MSFAPDEQIRVDPKFAPLLEELRIKLIAIYKRSIINSAEELDDTIRQLRNATILVDNNLRLDNSCHVRRLLLEFEYVAALKLHDYPVHYVQRVIEELELLGFSYPTRWADMSLELADQHAALGNADLANEIREVVAKNLDALNTRVVGIQTYLETKLPD